MIMYVTGAATASELKAVTTSLPVIRMADRPVVFLAVACTGHYPEYVPGHSARSGPRSPVIRR
jgi:hypothetical protein